MGRQAGTHVQALTPVSKPVKLLQQQVEQLTGSAGLTLVDDSPVTAALALELRLWQHWFQMKGRRLLSSLAGLAGSSALSSGKR